MGVINEVTAWLTDPAAPVLAAELIRWSWVGRHLDDIRDNLVQHVELTGLALLFGLLLAFPLALSAVKAESGPVVSPDDDGRRALSAAEAYGSDWVVVVDGDRRLLGWAHAGEAAERGRVGDAEIRPFQLQVRADDSLRAALNAMVQSRTGVAVRVSDGDRYEGIVTLELLSKEIS